MRSRTNAPSDRSRPAKTPRTKLTAGRKARARAAAGRAMYRRCRPGKKTFEEAQVRPEQFASSLRPTSMTR